MTATAMQVPGGCEPYRAYAPDAPPMADLVARAVIAAARALGEDPVEAVTGRTLGRRALAPAVSGMARVGACSTRRVARMLGMGRETVAKARGRGGEDFLRAEAAAAAAVDAALRWTEETRGLGFVEPPRGMGPGPAEVAAEAAAELAPAVVEAVAEVVVAGGVEWTPSPAPPIPPPASAPAAPLRQPRMLAAGAAAREVREALGEGADTVGGLMERLGLSEQVVRRALTLLSDQGEAQADPVTAEGFAARYWRLTPTAKVGAVDA